jgi:hypothetical protein
MGLAEAPLSTSTPLTQLNSITRLPLGSTLTSIYKVVVPYTPVAVLSGAFFYRNGRVVLGDQEHHQASLHWAQPLYCIAMLTVFAWPALLSAMTRTTSARRQLLSISTFAILTIISLAAIHYGTIAHPFLLADNRHYTFYIWRKIINRTSWTRYALAPVYAAMLRLWWIALGENFYRFCLACLSRRSALADKPLLQTNQLYHSTGEFIVLVIGFLSVHLRCYHTLPSNRTKVLSHHLPYCSPSSLFRLQGD